MYSGSRQHVSSCAVDRRVQPSDGKGAPKLHRKRPERHQKGAPEASETPPKGPRDTEHGPRQLHSPRRALRAPGPTPPRRLKRALKAPRRGPKTAPRGPQMGSRRRSGGSKKRLRTKKLKSCSRLGGSTIFEGRTASKMAPNRPDPTPKSAQKASPTEDSTRTVEQSAGTPEIRPRAADGRLEEGSDLTGN